MLSYVVVASWTESASMPALSKCASRNPTGPTVNLVPFGQQASNLAQTAPGQPRPAVDEDAGRGRGEPGLGRRRNRTSFLQLSEQPR